MATKALVTGATGFLGRHLVPYLESQGVEVTAINSQSADLTDSGNLAKIPEGTYDRIYHLAAWTKAGDFCLFHKGEQWIVNQQINTNALAYWRASQPQATMVTMGTSCAYPPELDLKEENYMVGEPDKDLYTYAMTKRMLYQGVLALNDQFDMHYRYLVPSTLYGPGFDEEDSHFIFDLVRKIVRGKQHGEPVVLWGDGSQVRELMYVGDAVRLIEMAVADDPDDILNLGSGQGHTIREYAEAICARVGYDPADIQYDTTRYTGVLKKVFNTDKIRSVFPDFGFTTIEAGLAEVVDDYITRFGS
jgi:GDP-L-fucose synthase